MPVLKDTRQFTCIDPMQHDPFVTSRGVIPVDEGGIAVVHDAELAKEIKEREPHAIVVEHGPFKGQDVRGQAMIVMPALPWETEWDRTHKKG
jgi:hypothetical protein